MGWGSLMGTSQSRTTPKTKSYTGGEVHAKSVHRSARRAVDVPSMEVLKAVLDGALGTQSAGGVPALSTDWDHMGLKVSSNLNHSMIVQKCSLLIQKVSCL